MRTRGEIIESYTEAFRKDSTCMEAARALYGRIGRLLSVGNGLSDETKVRCLAEEIDNILCGYMGCKEAKGKRDKISKRA